eukprot:gene33881-41794_t
MTALTEAQSVLEVHHNKLKAQVVEPSVAVISVCDDSVEDIESSKSDEAEKEDENFDPDHIVGSQIALNEWSVHWNVPFEQFEKMFNTKLIVSGGCVDICRGEYKLYNFGGTNNTSDWFKVVPPTSDWICLNTKPHECAPLVIEIQCSVEAEVDMGDGWMCDPLRDTETDDDERDGRLEEYQSFETRL